MESPPLVALVATLEIPSSYFFSWLWTGETPNYLSAIGAGLIFLAIIIMGAKVKRESERARERELERERETRSSGSAADITRMRVPNCVIAFGS